MTRTMPRLVSTNAAITSVITIERTGVAPSARLKSRYTEAAAEVVISRRSTTTPRDCMGKFSSGHSRRNPPNSIMKRVLAVAAVVVVGCSQTQARRAHRAAEVTTAGGLCGVLVAGVAAALVPSHDDQIMTVGF